MNVGGATGNLILCAWLHMKGMCLQTIGNVDFAANFKSHSFKGSSGMLIFVAD